MEIQPRLNSSVHFFALEIELFNVKINIYFIAIGVEPFIMKSSITAPIYILPIFRATHEPAYFF